MYERKGNFEFCFYALLESGGRRETRKKDRAGRAH